LGDNFKFKVVIKSKIIEIHYYVIAISPPQLLINSYIDPIISHQCLRGLKTYRCIPGTGRRLYFLPKNSALTLNNCGLL
jgi:hypothetical protein